MALGVRGDADAEVAELPQQPDQLIRVPQTLRVWGPLDCIPGRVTAQRQNVAYASVRVRPDDTAQLSARRPDAGQMANRGERGVLGDPAGDADRSVSSGAAGAVRDRNECRMQRLEPPDRRPQLALALVRPGWEELEGVRPAATCEQVANGRCAPRHGRRGPQCHVARLSNMRTELATVHLSIRSAP